MDRMSGDHRTSGNPVAAGGGGGGCGRRGCGGGSSVGHIIGIEGKLHLRELRLSSAESTMPYWNVTSRRIPALLTILGEHGRRAWQRRASMGRRASLKLDRGNGERELVGRARFGFTEGRQPAVCVGRCRSAKVADEEGHPLFALAQPREKSSSRVRVRSNQGHCATLHVDAAKAVDRRLHQLVAVHHAVVVSHGFAPHGPDLGHHVVRRGRGTGFGLRAINRTAKIVDHDLGAAARQL